MSVILDPAFYVTFDGDTSESVLERFVRENSEHPDRVLLKVDEGQYVIRQAGAGGANAKNIAKTLFTDDVMLTNSCTITYSPAIKVEETSNIFTLSEIPQLKFYVHGSEIGVIEEEF